MSVVIKSTIPVKNHDHNLATLEINATTPKEEITEDGYIISFYAVGLAYSKVAISKNELFISGTTAIKDIIYQRILAIDSDIIDKLYEIEYYMKDNIIYIILRTNKQKVNIINRDIKQNTFKMVDDKNKNYDIKDLCHSLYAYDYLNDSLILL